MKTFRVNVISLGVATIEAPTKAHARHRARAGDFDSYELHAPNAAITSLGEDKPVATSVLAPLDRPVVFSQFPVPRMQEIGRSEDAPLPRDARRS